MLGNIVVALIVLTAAIISGRKIYKTLTGKSGCSCGCGSSKEDTTCCCNSPCSLKK